jgi:hypothetical protein
MKKVNACLISRRLEIVSSVFILLGMLSFAPAASATVLDLSGLAHFLGFGKSAPPIEDPSVGKTTPEEIPAAKSTASASSPDSVSTKPNTVAAKSAPPASQPVVVKPSVAKVPAAKATTVAKPQASAKPQVPTKPQVPAKAKTVAVAKPTNVTTGLPSGANKADYEYKGFLVSSIYFNALLRDEGVNCSPEALSSIRDEKGSVLMKVCTKTVKTCMMEGVCQITRKKESRVFNYSGMVNKRPTFFELKNGDCIFGFGVSSECLDPFYTLAADKKYHKPGEVIYIPQVVGTILPGGQKHSGFFIVRDVGDRIQGSNRFDFFTGPMGWKDSGNPFFQIDLSASKKKFTYYRVTGGTAARFQVMRNFPKLPDDRMFDALTQAQ